MKYPEFFDKVESIELYDELSEFLGAVEDGIIEITYLDCVKLAGHSCPTVAGAYIATIVALRELFKSELPSRSNITVELRNPKDEGVTGVIGTVVAYICGASDEGGFAGIGGKMSRRGLLHYDCDIKGDIKLTDNTTNKSINVSISTSSVPGNPDMMPLMQKALGGMATKEEIQKFKDMWQGRVEYMLTHNELWDKIAKIS